MPMQGQYVAALCAQEQPVERAPRPLSLVDRTRLAARFIDR